MKMATKQNTKVAENNEQVEIRVPLILGQKAKVADEDYYAVVFQTGKNKGHEWILYLTTFVTVCGSFAFGSCVCVLFTSCTYLFLLDNLKILIKTCRIKFYIICMFVQANICYLAVSTWLFFFSQIGFSSPIQSAITEDLNLTLAEVGQNLHF